MSQANVKLVLILGALFGACLGNLNYLQPALAQLLADDSLPTPSSVVLDNKVFLIEQGTQVGNNLFHSFEAFSIPTGFQAHFTPNLSIQNLLARVTGNSISNIDGVIQVDGTANFFLINPNGILFGPNAALDVGGSFLATTAEQVKFSDDFVFETASASSNALLSISTPSGLQFGAAPGSIINRAGQNEPSLEAGGLQVSPNQTIALVGGEVSFHGGRISSPGSDILLASFDSNSSVPLNSNKNLSLVDQGNSNSFKDIELLNLSLLDSSGSNNGLIQLRGENISFQGGSVVAAQNLGNGIGKDIEINANGNVSLVGTAPVDSPYLDPLTLLNFGVQIPRRSNVRTSILGNGTAGSIRIKAKSLRIEAGGSLATLVEGMGTGGEILIQAKDTVSVTGRAPLLGFDPDLEAIAPIIRQRPEFFAQGFTASVISTTNLASGQGRDVIIETNQLLINNGGIINAGPLASGNAGNLRITAADLVELSGASATEAYPSAINVGAIPTPNGFPYGIPGDLFINTGILRIQDGARIGLDTTTAAGARGVISASDLVEISGSSPNGIFQSRISGQSTVDGIGGTVDINTPDLRILDGGSIFVAGVSSSAGGAIQVTADSLLLDNNSSITTASGALLGGNITLNIADALLMRRDSEISASAGASGSGGNIAINAELIVANSQENNDIIATAVAGAGGEINITTQGILGFQTSGEPISKKRSDLSASSQSGVDGTVTIESPDVDPDPVEIELNDEIALPDLAEGCFARQFSNDSFVTTGQAGLPIDPVSPVTVDSLWQDMEPLHHFANKPQQVAVAPPSPLPSNQSKRKLAPKEAVDWKLAPNGKVQLISTEHSSTFELASISDCGNE